MRTKKIILDVDPGIDDAMALTLALFDATLEVTAVTAVGGNVMPDLATRNVQAIVEALDPPRWPRIGVASQPDEGLPAVSVPLHGADGLGNAELIVSRLHHRHPAEKVIFDSIRSEPDQISILALGPLTNVARALARDPSLDNAIDRIIIMGGTMGGPGNVTPAAEFNFYCDPFSAKAVLKSRATKILIPLDVSSQVTFSYDLMDRLPGDETRAGRMLRQILPYSFRAHRQYLGLESIFLHDCVALAAAVHPELFTLDMAAVDVETAGELTTGAMVSDRRPVREWRANVAVASSVDVEGVHDYLLRALEVAGTASADAAA